MQINTTYCDKNVIIGKNNYIELGVIIMDNVTIGNNNKIYKGTIIYPNTKIGNDNVILDNNILGEFAVEANVEFKEKIYNGLEIGNNNFFHISNTIFSGYYNKTIIGDNNKFLSYVKIHHDNIIHNNVLFYPNSTTAGLCVLLDYSTMGMNSCLQQKSTLGSFSMIGMGSIASHNVFPFYIYFNQQYKRFNNKKVPNELEIEKYIDELSSLIKELKSNSCNKEIVEKYNLPQNINYYINEFLDNITINKL